MNLTHYREKSRWLLRWPAPAQRIDMKPRGLWVSVDGEYDWKWWCESEEFNVQALQHKYRVTLTKKAHLLMLSTIQELDEFTETYKPPKNRMSDEIRALDYHIDWPAIAEKYDGIIIAPYQWERRLSLMWYYGWDCASGCIWGSKAIDKVTKI